MSSLSNLFRRHYSSEIQLSAFQAQVIASAIATRSPGCRLLVFGVGNDSGLWLALNESGVNVFLETSDAWARVIAARYPGMTIQPMPTFGLTVETSAALTAADLAKYPPPESLRSSAWDVIVVDAPPGYSPGDPGRAVAVSWAASLAHRGTHVFVDDYDRPLEQRLADLLLRPRGTTSIVIPASELVNQRKTFWSVGDPLA